MLGWHNFYECCRNEILIHCNRNFEKLNFLWKAYITWSLHYLYCSFILIKSRNKLLSQEICQNVHFVLWLDIFMTLSTYQILGPIIKKGNVTSYSNVAIFWFGCEWGIKCFQILLTGGSNYWSKGFSFCSSFCIVIVRCNLVSFTLFAYALLFSFLDYLLTSGFLKFSLLLPKYRDSV